MPELRLGQVIHEPLPEGDVTFSFGGGFNVSSLRRFLRPLEDLIIRIDDVDYEYQGAGYNELGGWVLFVRHVNSVFEPVGDQVELEFSSVSRIHIY